MKTCPYCGENDLQDNAKVCKHCGNQIKKSKSGFLIYFMSFLVLICLIGGFFFWPLWLLAILFFIMGKVF